MGLSRISVYSHKNNLGDKVWNPAIRWKNKYAVFIVVEDEDGQTGTGECWCFDTAPDALVAFLRTEVVPHFIGCELSQSESIVQRLYQRATLSARHGILSSALSGLDIALFDLQSRQTNVPLCALLGSKEQREVPVYASGGLYGEGKDNQDLANEMASMADKGFYLTKMKIGALPVSEDAERVNQVLAALPSNVSLIIDGVYSYNVDSALDLMGRINGSRIVAFQSPVAAHDIRGMRDLNASGVPVMATEAEYRSEIHQQLIDQSAITFLQTAPIACGGISRLQELYNQVDGTSVRLSLEVSSTAVAFLAASHFAAAYPNVAHVEYHCLHLVFFDQLNLNFDTETPGNICLSEQVGLGFELDTRHVTHEF
jgi:L-alanine-DL-glutamate epimerase-like enolase superfamily enzyme